MTTEYNKWIDEYNSFNLHYYMSSKSFIKHLIEDAEIIEAIKDVYESHQHTNLISKLNKIIHERNKAIMINSVMKIKDIPNEENIMIDTILYSMNMLRPFEKK